MSKIDPVRLNLEEHFRSFAIVAIDDQGDMSYAYSVAREKGDLYKMDSGMNGLCRMLAEEVDGAMAVEESEADHD